MADAVLPPLPPSDQKSLDWNRPDGYYGVKSRDFWGPNAIIRETPKDFEKCDHNFIYVPEGVQCQKCHMGLGGKDLNISEGKLFHRGEPIEI